MKQSLHRDEATNPSRQPIALIGPISPIRPIGPICPISPIGPIGPINPIPLGGGREGAAGCVGGELWLGAVRAAGFGCLHKQKSPPRFLSKGFSLKKAATYSPTGVQYHRRGRA